VFWDGADISTGKWFLMFWNNTVLFFPSVKGSDCSAILHELLDTWTHTALCSHKLSETAHPMMQYHFLENRTKQPHHLHKCTNIFHTVSNNNQYTQSIPNLYQLLFTTVLCFDNKLLARYRSVTLCPPAHLHKWRCQVGARQWTVNIKL